MRVLRQPWRMPTRLRAQGVQNVEPVLRRTAGKLGVFTPREVIRLMALLLVPDGRQLSTSGIVKTVYVTTARGVQV